MKGEKTMEKMKRDYLMEYAEEPEMLFLDEEYFDEALIGFMLNGDVNVAVYDKNKCIEVMIMNEYMTEEEAWEYFDYNIQGAFVGEYTPLFVDVFDPSLISPTLQF